MNRKWNNLLIAFEAIESNKLKAALTTLGIIFGVAAVIVMMGISKGAKKEVLEQMKYVGVNNIWIKSLHKNDPTNTNIKEEIEQNSLNYSDYTSIKNILSSEIENTTPIYSYNAQIQSKGVSKSVTIYGVNSSYFNIFSFQLFAGTYFSPNHEKLGLPVCIISSSLASRIFSTSDPLFQYVKCDNIWLMVIGVYRTREMSLSTTDNSSSIDFSENDIYLPAKTILMRYGNSSGMAFESKNIFEKFNAFLNGSEVQSIKQPVLNSIVIQIKESEKLLPAISIINRLLKRRLPGEDSYTVFAPELILKQQQRTNDIFNVVLGVIAGISLLVGGIGIMNIMYANVTDRYKEIGTRLAVGASPRDILEQFLAEAIIISCSGGLTGIFLGLILSKITFHATGVLSIVSLTSVLIAFVVSVSVGIIFGFVPARSASRKDPIESLRQF